MDKNVSNKILYCTFFCNLLILFHHANLNGYVDDVGPFAYHVMNFFTDLAALAMTWFFFISAYLFFRNFNIKDMKRKLYSRCTSIMVPYIIWNTIALMVKQIAGKNYFANGFFGFIRSGYIFYQGTGGANGPLWYLFRIFEFILLCGAIYLVICNNKKWLTILVCLVITVFNCISQISYFGFTYFLPVYICGAYFGYNQSTQLEQWMVCEKMKQHSCRLWYTVMFIIVFSVIAQNCDIYGISLFSRYILIIFVVLLLVDLPDVVIKKEKLQKFVSGDGMWLYCTHYLVYLVIRSVLLKMHVGALLTYFLLIMVSISLMICTWMLMYNFARPLLNIMTGGRNKE